MKSVKSDVLQFRGNHYEFGLFQGQQLKQTALVKNREVMHRNMLRKYVVDTQHIEQLLQAYAPQLLDEITGLQQALQLTKEEAFVQFAGYYANQKSGCSILIGSDYLIRNYDNDPKSYDGRFVLFQPTDGGFATIGPTMQVTGRMDGLNEHGLALGYNFVNSRQHGDGFVCNMIGRIVLQYCQNVEEAVALLKEIPHKHAFNYCLVDQSGEQIVVEASTRRVTTTKTLACANHFDVLTEENRYRMEDSKRRQALMLKQPLTAKAGYELLNDSTAGVFATKYGAWDGTIHTACYYPQQLLMTMTLGGDALPMPFHFKRWLAGEDTFIASLKGKLVATNGFANE